MADRFAEACSRYIEVLDAVAPVWPADAEMVRSYDQAEQAYRQAALEEIKSQHEAFIAAQRGVSGLQAKEKLKRRNAEVYRLNAEVKAHLTEFQRQRARHAAAAAREDAA